jgi:hypothetical protein
MKINPASAYMAGFVLGIPAFLIAGKVFVWLMSVFGHGA